VQFCSQVPPSILHSNVALESEEEKVKVADVLFTVPDGPESMVVSGPLEGVVPLA
jgi:hypothetical protein